MRIIRTALVAGGLLTTFKVPYWVILCFHLAMGGGAMADGWRIINSGAALIGAAVYRLVTTVIG